MEPVVGFDQPMPSFKHLGARIPEYIQTTRSLLFIPRHSCFTEGFTEGENEAKRIGGLQLFAALVTLETTPARRVQRRLPRPLRGHGGDHRFEQRGNRRLAPVAHRVEGFAPVHDQRSGRFKHAEVVLSLRAPAGGFVACVGPLSLLMDSRKRPRN